MNNIGKRIDRDRPNKTVSARIEMDVYEFFKEEEIPLTNIINILLRGFVTSEDKIGLLRQCLEKDDVIKLDDDEKKLNLFAKRLGTTLWTESFITLYKEIKDLP